MSTDEETSTDVQPKKMWLMFRRRPKVSSCESQAAPQEHRDSRAASGAQAAAAESRAAAPHSARGRIQALLHSLRRGSRALLSRAAAGIRRGTNQPATHSDLSQGTAAGTAATAPAAGAQSRAAAPLSPCCPPSPSLGPLEVLGGQGTGTALGLVVATPDGEEKGCISLEPDGELDSLGELSQVEQDRDQSWRSEMEKPPVGPHETWAEHGNLTPCTGTGQAPALPSRAPQSRAEASVSEMTLDDLPASPSPNQLEAHRQWTMAVARMLLTELQSEEGDWSTEAQSSSSGEESSFMSYIYEPKPHGPCNGTGLLGLCPQNEDQSAAKGEGRNIKESSKEKWDDIMIHTSWVSPSYPQVLVEPGSPLEEEEDDNVPSTSRAPVAPMDTQAAAAALVGAPEDEEHPVHPTVEAREVAKTAASAASGVQAAAAESRAVALHSPWGRGWTLLRLLWRGACAILSRITAVIWLRGHQPAIQQHLCHGMEAGTAVMAPTAGAQSRAAAPHSSCCPPSPSLGPLQVLGGQGTGAALGLVVATPDGEKGCISLEPDGELDSLGELSQVEQDRDQSRRSEVEKPPVGPHETWAEHSNLTPCTGTGQAPALPSRAPQSRAEASVSEMTLDDLPASPSPNQVEAHRQWAMAVARILLTELQSEEGDWSTDAQSSSSGEESSFMSYIYEPKPHGPCNGTGLLGLCPQNEDQSAAKGEGRNKESSKEKWDDIMIHTSWVSPSYPQVLVEPGSPLEEEEDDDVPSTSRAPVAPMDTQAAAAALIGAPVYYI